MSEDRLWTFVVNFEDGIFVSQFHAATLGEAICQYNESDPSGVGAVPLGNEPVALDGLRRVWCDTQKLEDNKDILANIIETKLEQV